MEIIPLDLNLNDVLRLKRPHPCGGTDWQVTRLGADIGLRCLGCNRRVLLERPVLEKRLKQFVSHAASMPAEPPTLDRPVPAEPSTAVGPEHVEGRVAGTTSRNTRPSPPAGRGKGNV